MFQPIDSMFIWYHMYVAPLAVKKFQFDCPAAEVPFWLPQSTERVLIAQTDDFDMDSLINWLESDYLLSQFAFPSIAQVFITIR